MLLSSNTISFASFDETRLIKFPCGTHDQITKICKDSIMILNPGQLISTVRFPPESNAVFDYTINHTQNIVFSLILKLNFTLIPSCYPRSVIKIHSKHTNCLSVPLSTLPTLFVRHFEEVCSDVTSLVALCCYPPWLL